MAMSFRTRELVTVLVLTGIALIVLLDTRDYPPAVVAGDPGAAFFPRVLAVVLLLLAGLLAFRALAVDREKALEKEEWTGLGKAAWLVLLVALFLLLFDLVGFYLLIPPLLASVMALMGERQWLALVSVPLAFTLFVHLVFVWIFGLDLPTGPI